MSLENKNQARRQFKRIVHLIADDGSGGGPATVIRHIKFYHQEYDIIFLSGGEGSIVEYCKTERVKCIKLPIERLWKCLWGWIPLWWHLRRLDPDLLILHGQWAAPMGALVGKLARVESIMYIAQWPAFYTDWDLFRVVRNHIAESIPVHLCDKVICISRGNLYQYQIRFPGHLDKLIHISNPYDTSCMPTREEAVETRQKWGWSKDLIHVVSVGRIATQKHLEWLLQSWVIVQKEVPEARLWIVGDGEEEERMHQLAKNLEITDTCAFLGAQPKGIDFINAADIVAMTTLYEGHANIPMEAHACQKPIVANAVDGVRISVTDGVDGFLVTAGDVQGFADKLIILCRSEEIRNRLGEEGLRSLQQFSLDKVMTKYTTVITTLIDRNPNKK